MRISRLLGMIASVAAFSLAQMSSGQVRPWHCNFDGQNPDGKRTDDLAVYYPATGTWYIHPIYTSSVTYAESWGFDEAVPVPGDYDGDGKADLAVYQRETGNWYIKSLGGPVLAWATNWGWTDAIQVPGDYDGDGKMDLAVYHRDTGNWYIRTLAGQVLAWATNWGWADADPVPGDYDGDGKTDLAVYHRATGNWYIKSLNGPVIAWAMNWGWRWAWPVPADYDGDGKTDLAVYQRETGNWYIRSLNGPVLAFGTNWGFKEATPEVGDYDGDGKADLAVYHRQTGRWYVRTLNNPKVLAWGWQWGWNQTVPVETCAEPASEGMRVLAFGDSITYGDASSSGGPATGYPILLERKLNVQYGGYFHTINAGNPGEYTWDGVNRLASVLSQYMPEMLLLMEGTNDALFDYMFQATGSDLREMIDDALGVSAHPVIATIPPVISNDQHDRSLQFQRILAFNPTIVSIAEDYGIPLADVFDEITSVPNWQNLLMDQDSANHPNDAGYLRVRDAFFNAVVPSLQSGEPYCPIH